MITKPTWEKLKTRMSKSEVLETDLRESFICGSGSGGQKINKTASCVQLLHLPSGIKIRCQKTRSQADNRYWARRELCEQTEEKLLGEKSARKQKAEKIRRQKRRRSRRAKAKMLDSKSHQGEKKRLRRSVRSDD